jgi:hypothetical protein
VKTIRTLVLASIMGTALAPASAAALEPGGCPLYTEEGAVLTTPPADPDVEYGPYGFANQRIQGVGIEVEDDVVTAVLTVEDMQARVIPGYQTTYWSVEAMLGLEELEHRHEGPYRAFTAYYDVNGDRFSFQLDGTGLPLDTPVLGEVVMGPGGGVRISATMEQLGLPEGIDVLADVWGNTGSSAYYGVNVSSSRWLKEGPAAVPLVPCPGASLNAAWGGASTTLYVRGWVLPQGLTSGVIEELVGEEWVSVASIEIDELGAYWQPVAFPRAEHVLRVRAPSETYGDVLSPPVVVSPA